MNPRLNARLLAGLLVISLFASPVLGNDAGTGSDAGGSTTTAANLTADNGTYYGNVSSTDTDDYYAVNMSNDTGIAVQLTSPSGADFDLYLYSSSGSTIDSSLTTGVDDVTSNSTTVGGTTVYIRVQRWTGSGQYTMQVWIFATSSSGGGGGPGTSDDAGSGMDAGSNSTTGVNLTGVNATYWGHIGSTGDSEDFYNVQMPDYHQINVDLTWNSTSMDLDMYLYDDQGGVIDWSLSWSGQSEDVTSGNGDYGGENVTIRVRQYSGVGDYNLSISFENISNLPVFDQNDTGIGEDASDDYNDPTEVLVEIGQNNYTGYAAADGDQVDEYSSEIPANHGIAIRLDFNASEANFNLALAFLNATIIDNSNSWWGSPEEVTSNGTYVGNSTILFEVSAQSGEGAYNLTIWIFDLDTDGDGHWDLNETNCGSDPDDASSVPDDFDGDGTCDQQDADDDNDGVDDVSDRFPYDSSEWADSDNDGTGDNADPDDDNDGWNDTVENDCGSNAYDRYDYPTDTDGDGVCNALDNDDDGDGYNDTDDAFPRNSEEWLDTDRDGIGNNADNDDDGDYYSDEKELTCGSNPVDFYDRPPDLDGDGVCDVEDTDVDGDGFSNDMDAFPDDGSEWFDDDGDGVGNNADSDDDGDGVNDDQDAFPRDANEWLDNDGDDVGDNGDADDDNDGWLDVDENDCGTDPMLASSIPDDVDGDMSCDVVDEDDDNDGVPDQSDMFPYDNTEWDDTDLDGIGNNADADDDGDGWADEDEPNCGTDSLDANSIPADFDGDMICDPTDNDDDNDMVTDWDDAFPFDAAEQYDTDSDGIGNNADEDDDGDNWLDQTEALCFTDALAANSVPEDTDSDFICDVMDEDDDGDGVNDGEDAFPKDGTEWEDRNGDGLGDNAHPLSIVEKMSLNPILSIAILGLLMLGLAGGSALYLAKKQEGEVIPLYQDDDYSNYDDASMGVGISQAPLPPSGYGEEDAYAGEEGEAPPPPPGFESDAEEAGSGAEVPPPPPGFGEEEADAGEEGDVSPPPPGFESEDESASTAEDGDIPPPPPGLD